METVKQTKEFKIVKKRNGRFAIKSVKGKWINGEEKIKILSAEGLIKVSIPKKVETPVEEAAPEAPATDAPAEDTAE